MASKLWTEQENEFLKINYSSVNRAKISQALSRSMSSIHHHAHRMGLKAQILSYKIDEEKFKNYWLTNPTTTSLQAAAAFNVARSTVLSLIKKLGLPNHTCLQEALYPDNIPHLNVSDCAAAYVAGLVDAEGYVGIHKQWEDKKQRRLSFSEHVAISMTDKFTVNRLREMFGGSFRLHKSINYPNGIQSHKPKYTWTVECKKAVSFIHLIMPYLQIKRENAKILLDLRQSKIDEAQYPKHNNGCIPRKAPEHVIKYRQYLCDRVSYINNHGLDFPFDGADTNIFADLNDVKLAYIAGYIDGEGYVGITKRSFPRRRLQPYILYAGRVQITCTNYPILLKLQNAFGGLLFKFVSKEDMLARKERFVWRVDLSHASSFLKKILLYLNIKRCEAECIIALERTKSRHRAAVSDDVAQKREKFYIFCLKRNPPINQLFIQNEVISHNYYVPMPKSEWEVTGGK